MAVPRRTPQDAYSAEESAQMSTAARLSQSVTVAAANTAVTLQMPSIIVNNTAAAGNVAYHLVDDAVGEIGRAHV